LGGGVSSILVLMVLNIITPTCASKNYGYFPSRIQNWRVSIS